MQARKKRQSLIQFEKEVQKFLFSPMMTSFSKEGLALNILHVLSLNPQENKYIIDVNVQYYEEKVPRMCGLNKQTKPKTVHTTFI